jgi:hypothetical protein
MSAYEFITANMHDSHIGGDSPIKANDDNDDEVIDMDTTMLDKLQANKTIILANAAKKLPSGDISRLLSSKMSKTHQDKDTKGTDSTPKREVTIDGIKY